MRARWLWLALLAGLVNAAEAPLDAAEDARYRQLTSELRCLVCQNQNIADSNAPLAADLRDQVRTQILAGQSDRQITQYLTDRYGDFVLYRPPFKFITAALWLGPGLLVLGALGAAWSFSRRSLKSGPTPVVDAEKLRRLLDGQK